MPIRKPQRAAAAAPIKIAMPNRIPTEGITLAAAFVKNAPENAPTHIKPAWPKLNSPKMPTVKFKETAKITYVQIGTRRPFSKFVIRPAMVQTWINTQKAITMEYVRRLWTVALFFVFFIFCTYTFSWIALPKIPVGRTNSTIISTENTMASESSEEI